MIFDKDVSFPYPVLYNSSNDYLNSEFIVKTTFIDDDDSYIFQFSFQITSQFIENLVNQGKAEIYITIASKDTKFKKIDINNKQIVIMKNQISLNDFTRIQAFIITKQQIRFDKNNDLDKYYDNYKKDIYLDSSSVLAISNIEKYDGGLRKPFDIFEYRIDSRIDSDIKINLERESIVIIYRDIKYQYNEFYSKKSLNNHYVYLGLQKVLMQLLKEVGIEEVIDFTQSVDDPSSPLLRKIITFLKTKKITELNESNIDSVIHKISDKIIDKHYKAIEGLRNQNGD